MIHWSNELKKLKNDIGNEYVKKRDNNTTIEAGNMTVKTTSASLRLESSNNIDLIASGFIHCNNKLLKNVARPTEDNDAATKAYVDSGKVLRVIDKTNITITRINNIGASDNNGMYCKIAFNNAEDRRFINAAARARKDISFYFAWDNVHLHKLSNLSMFESGGALGGICFAHLPAFWDASKLTAFFNKGFTKFEILTIGV